MTELNQNPYLVFESLSSPFANHLLPLHRKETTGGRCHQDQEKEEEVVVECLLKTANNQPSGQVSAPAAEVGEGQGLLADGGGVH